MVRVLHVIQALSLGGAARSVFSASKYSSRLGNFHHSIVSLAPTKDDPQAFQLAEENSLQVIRPEDRLQLLNLVAASDIVLLHWWNNPELDDFLRLQLPPTRLIAWLHVGGRRDPQAIPDGLVSFLDLAVAASPYTHEGSAFTSLSAKERADKSTMIYPATDFERLASVTRVPHRGFNVGYIGTVDFSKMHSAYVRMSASAAIPDVKFIVCGYGDDIDTIRQQAAEMQRAESFDVRGMVADISPVLSILDAYGYPLCEDNYSAAELNLQEVMYCGIPPVVFPYGGVQHLVINDVTGYVVRSEKEYTQALEHLHRVPSDRTRLGNQAAQYARRVFGAERAALILNEALTNMMRIDKSVRRPFSARQPATTIPFEGARRFIESLQSHSQLFSQSIVSECDATLFKLDADIMRLSPLVKRGGIKSYRTFHGADPYLCFWSGLVSFAEGDMDESAREFVTAIELQFPHWRLWWYLAQVAHSLGSADLERISLERIESLAPTFGARERMRRLVNGEEELK